MSTNIEKDTGEVIEDNSHSGEVIFNNVWLKPAALIDQDLSRETEEVFEEVAPFAIDATTGKLLNDKSVPMLISKGFVNVYEKIQSFYKECDIYSILEKYAASGDSTLLNARDAGYGDLSELPNNLNDFALFVNNNFKALENLNPELAKMVIDKNVKVEDITNKANEIFEKRLEEYNSKHNNNNESEDNK